MASVVVLVVVWLSNLDIFIFSLDVSPRLRGSRSPRKRHKIGAIIITKSRRAVLFSLIESQWLAVKCIKRRLASYETWSHRCPSRRRRAVVFSLPLPLFLNRDRASSRPPRMLSRRPRLLPLVVVYFLAEAVFFESSVSASIVYLIHRNLSMPAVGARWGPGMGDPCFSFLEAVSLNTIAVAVSLNCEPLGIPSSPDTT
jgi:hypothetical protein